MTKPHVLILILMLLAQACNQNNNEEPNSEPVWQFHISFILSDSIGNNLLPYDLPDNPVVDPYSFYAFNDFRENTGRVTRHPEHGYFFYMSIKHHEIVQTPNFEQDSIFFMYACFDNLCDTIKFYKNDLGNDEQVDNAYTPIECTAQKIIWNSDTIYNHACERLKIIKNQ